MDWLTFITKIVDALVWPGLVLVLLWWLRPHLGGLARRLEELTLPGGAKAKFRQELEEAKEQAIKVYSYLDLEPPHIGTPSEEPETQYLQLAAMFPEAAILQSYQEIERIIGEHAEKAGITSRPPLRVINFLHQKGLIDPAAVDVFNRLRTLRNEAAHGGSSLKLSLDEAVEYRALCRFVADALDAAFRKLSENVS
jgi:hypothetical protein